MCKHIINNLLYKILVYIFYFITLNGLLSHTLYYFCLICLLKKNNYTSPFSNSTCYIMHAFGLHTSGEIFTKISVATTK